MAMAGIQPPISGIGSNFSATCTKATSMYNSTENADFARGSIKQVSNMLSI